MNNSSNNLIIISLDALRADDIELMKKLPNFSILIQNGAYAKRVKTIYPSLTYPAHTTIVTGNYPKNHGIVNNKLMIPENKKAPWFWYRKYIKTKTIYDLAKESGLTTAAIFWPVSAKSSIKYNMPEIFSYNKYVSQEISSLLSGSLLYQLKLFKKYKHMKKGINEPELDDFAIQCTLDTLKYYHPNLLLLHLLDLDTQRHNYGTHSSEALDALKRHDERLGKILMLLNKYNLDNNYNIVVLGDHGFQDFDKYININGIFKNENLLSVDINNNIVSWEAFAKSCDGSSYIYLKDSSNKLLKNHINSILEKLITNPKNGIKAIYNNSELVSLGGDPNATFMLEANEGFVFSEKIDENLITPAKSTKENSVGTHGYSPENSNLDTLFIGYGPSFKSNTSINNMNLIDIAPTLAKSLEIEFPNCDGSIIYELLKKNKA